MATVVDANANNPYAQSGPVISGNAQANYMQSGTVDNALMGTTGYMPIGLQYDPTLANSARTQGQTAIAGLDDTNQYFKGLMAGNQPSVAQQQTQQGIAQANVQGMQVASGARGMDRAAAFRMAANNASQASANAAVQGGTQRLQERQQQQQMGAQGYMSGVNQQANFYNQQRAQDVAEQQGQEALQNQQNAQFADLAKSNASNSQKGMGSVIGGIGSAVGSLFSDINAKENIQPGEPSMGSALMRGSVNTPRAQTMFSNMSGEMGNQYDPSLDPNRVVSDESTKEDIHPLDGVKPYTFDYKDEVAHKMASKAANDTYARVFLDAKQPREGVMAQDLKKNPETKPMVRDTPDGLAIEGKRALAFLMGNQAALNDRLNKLEGSHGSRA